MFDLEILDSLFVIWAFLFQLVLIVHFALRKWRFDLAIKLGRWVYALCLPAVALSIILLSAGKPWSLWVGGFIYLAWAVYGYTVEYVLHIQWRSPVRWSILVPYVLLYLATVMFYWWPLLLIFKPLWYGYALLYLISTWLNVASHQKKERLILKEALK
jgi:hypothetical protein